MEQKAGFFRHFWAGRHLPARVFSEAAPVQIAFELYNLRPNEVGQVRDEVEERVLTLYEEPGFLESEDTQAPYRIL